MSADDFKGHPEDRELYLRLLIERDGPPDKAVDERDPGRKNAKALGGSAAQRSTDPEAAISRRPRRTAA